MLKLSFNKADNFSFPEELQQLISKILAESEREIRTLLPGLADSIDIAIIPTEKVTPETGATARALSATSIEWLVNPRDERGTEAIVKQRLKGSFFHEAHHATRMKTIPWGGSILDKAVFEGLATVFQRDYTHGKPPWGSYDKGVIKAWTKELIGLNVETANQQHYFFNHPDGRRWIAYRVGSYIVDEAIKNSKGETAASLVDRPTSEIVALAHL